jgi:hypothetical protein
LRFEPRLPAALLHQADITRREYREIDVTPFASAGRGAEEHNEPPTMAARQFGEGLLLLGADGDVRHVRGLRKDADSLGSLDPVVTSAESGSG